MNTSRRSFITKSLIGAGIITTGTNLLNNEVFAETATPKISKISLKDNDVILFQGDSITDAGRDRNNKNTNDANALGRGYAFLAASQLLKEHASKTLQIFNKGISGNRVPDLQGRWEEDTFAIQPTVLSILIGVNDFWRTLDSGANNSAKQYRTQYQQLLDETLKKFPTIKLIIGEPFAIRDVGHISAAWYPDFLGYQEAAGEIAKEFNAPMIPYQKIFDEAQQKATGAYWAADGIHPSLAGAQLMADAWIKQFKS